MEFYKSKYVSCYILPTLIFNKSDKYKFTFCFLKYTWKFFKGFKELEEEKKRESLKLFKEISLRKDYNKNTDYFKHYGF